MRKLAHHNALTHGHSADGRTTAEYTCWSLIIQRCENPNATVYAEYGGRGITMCRRWRESFANFYADMGPKPTPKHTIERDNVNGHYEPSNCRWVTRKEQARNRRNSRWLTAGGRTMLLVDWALHLQCGHTTILRRLRAGWSIEQALTTPVRNSTVRRRHGT